jgi:hypothetical protein
MPRWQRAYVVGTCAVIGFALAYTLSDFGGWPKLFYLPYDGEWVVARGIPDRIAIVYVGLIAWGVGGALIGAGIGGAATMAWKKPLPQVAIGLLGAWALTAFALAGAYYTWNLYPF